MLLWYETVHQLLLFARRPASVFLVIIMPVILLVVFTELFGNELIEDKDVTTAQFYTPALAVFGAVTACYSYLAVATANARDTGILKRIRGTPLPPAIFVAARIVSVSIIALIAVAVVMAVGITFYGIKVYWEKVPAGLVALTAGTMTFASLGMMVTALCRTSELVQAVTSATLLPLAFVSNIFIRPFREQPAWMQFIGDVFPLKHFSDAFTGMFRPGLKGHGFVWQETEEIYAILPELAIMIAWGLLATALAAYFFRWDNRSA